MASKLTAGLGVISQEHQDHDSMHKAKGSGREGGAEACLLCYRLSETDTWEGNAHERLRYLSSVLWESF